MKLAEAHTLMALQQYRSRKSKVARTQCLNKKTVLQLTQIPKETAALCLNDAIKCYDHQWVSSVG